VSTAQQFRRSGIELHADGVTLKRHGYIITPSGPAGGTGRYSCPRPGSKLSPTRLEGAVPTRRIFELIVITNVLFWPARSTVRLWGKKQLASSQPGSIGYTVGEVIVTLL
jgi:hypothetical protein